MGDFCVRQTRNCFLKCGLFVFSVMEITFAITLTNSQLTVEGFTIATTEILELQDAGQEEDLESMARKNLLMKKSNESQIQVIRRNETRRKTGLVVADSMEDHLLHGPGVAVAPHPNGRSQEISLRKARVKNRGKSLMKERIGSHRVVGADQDTGKFRISL